MCLSKKDIDIPYIRVKEKTNKAKYEFLRRFYTIWNQITKTRSRVIIDTHAGSGLVELEKNRNLYNKNERQLIYGSPLIAILKTLKISKNLKIILNEGNNTRYSLLKECINEFKEQGIPIFKKIDDELYFKSLETKRKKKLKKKPDYKFPETPNAKCPSGYQEIRENTNAEIIIYNEKIENIIDQILHDHLGDSLEELKPIALFLVDPCGVVGWNDVIKKICNRSNKNQGTEVILNWSWDAINRNLNNDSKNKVLSTIYGIEEDTICKEFNGFTQMNEFLDKYIAQLKKYFKYVIHVGVEKDRLLKPKRSDYKKYVLILCTNNQSALSLGGYNVRMIKKKMRDGHLDIEKFAKSVSTQ